MPRPAKTKDDSHDPARFEALAAHVRAVAAFIAEQVDAHVSLFLDGA